MFFLVVGCAALLIGRRAGFLTAAVSSLVGLLLLLAGRAGWLVNIDRPRVDIINWVLLSTAFFISAYVTGLVIRQAERAIGAAKSELVERIRTELEVRRLNSQLEKALGEGKRRFRRVFEVSPVAIVITTLEDGRLVEANDAYWILSGHDPKTSIGKSTLELRSDYDVDQRRQFVSALTAERSIRHPNHIFVDEAGISRPTMAFYELIDLDGQPAILSMFYDMTEQVEAQNALQRSEEQVRGLLNAVPDEIFELRSDGRVLQHIAPAALSASETPNNFAGRSIDEFMPPSVVQQIRFAMERSLESGMLHVIEYELPRGDRTSVHEARVVISGSATVLMIVRDVSLQKWMETERERIIDELVRRNTESETLRETTVIVTSTLDVAEAVQRILKQLKRVIAYDSASIWLYKNNTAHMIDGDSIPDVPEAGKYFTVSANEPDHPLWVEDAPYILLDDVQQDYPQFREPPINYIRGWLGVPLKVRGRLIGLLSLDSRSVGRFTHADARLAVNFANQASIALENARLFSDLEAELEHHQLLIRELDAINANLAREIEERKRAEQALQEMAVTDPLTGLFNRRHFFHTAGSSLTHAARYRHEVTIMMLDVDHFKLINDTYGHRIGDLALQHLVSGIRSCIRKTDMAARFGGDEFAILMPETDHVQALQVAGRIHHFIRSNPVPDLDTNVTCTVSVGIASFTAQQDGTSIDALFEQADQALYKAKQAGRNQTCLYNDHKA
jgi:diguanylate cyclase (GGDEF)-like protein/PAS domain S-box-containing protein